MNEPLTKDKIIRRGNIVDVSEDKRVTILNDNVDLVTLADLRSAMRLLREKIEEMLIDLRKQVKQYEESEGYCSCNCNDLCRYAGEARERIQALLLVKVVIDEAFGEVGK